jgi:CheY-like chemotaxis protein
MPRQQKHLRAHFRLQEFALAIGRCFNTEALALPSADEVSGCGRIAPLSAQYVLGWNSVDPRQFFAPMAHILLVDDEADVLYVLGQFLMAGGHTLTYGQPGPELQYLLADTPYDLVITDLAMPGFSGHQLAEWLGEHRPAVPVIAVSGAPLGAAKSLDRFAAVITKPVRRDDLLGAVRRVVDRSSSRTDGM